MALDLVREFLDWAWVLSIEAARKRPSLVSGQSRSLPDPGREPVCVVRVRPVLCGAVCHILCHGVVPHSGLSAFLCVVRCEVGEDPAKLTPHTVLWDECSSTTAWLYSADILAQESVGCSRPDLPLVPGGSCENERFFVEPAGQLSGACACSKSSPKPCLHVPRAPIEL